MASPETVTVSVPPSVPLVKESVMGAIVSPLLKLTVPPEIASELPTLDTVLAGLKVFTPPDTLVLLVAL